MYCSNCGTHLNSYDSFCSSCGMKRGIRVNPTHNTVSPRSNTSYVQPAQKQYARFQAQPAVRTVKAAAQAPIHYGALLGWSIASAFVIWPLAIYGFIRYAQTKKMPYAQAYPAVERSTKIMMIGVIVATAVGVVLGISI